MERMPINPWSWSGKLGFDQAELIEGHQRQLVCSGQDAGDQRARRHAARSTQLLVLLEATAVD